ncbi:hypothetical protein L596_029888 [Steinernema carpocapsae]|uniref:Uncharacterized protein n=1 Tax=Steinernema carpocapsae TaxID=34508 RepID=A0A4U5LR39_STECR|nr:hypothetical protein L596_029888 [Steinernema carpocapsae]
MRIFCPSVSQTSAIYVNEMSSKVDDDDTTRGRRRHFALHLQKRGDKVFSQAMERKNVAMGREGVHGKVCENGYRN